jgi:hypothetical protein
VAQNLLDHLGLVPLDQLMIRIVEPHMGQQSGSAS